MSVHSYFKGCIFEYSDGFKKDGFKLSKETSDEVVFSKEEYDFIIRISREMASGPEQLFFELIYKPSPKLLELFYFQEAIKDCGDEWPRYSMDKKSSHGIRDSENVGWHLNFFKQYKDVLFKMPMPEPYWTSYKKCYRKGNTIKGEDNTTGKDFVYDDCPFDENLNVKEEYLTW